MTTLELQTINELKDSETAWNQLLYQSLDNNPFLTYEWLTLWWKYFGKGRELKLFKAECKGPVPLVVPVMYSKCKVFGSRRRRVEFVASGDSDYQGFLVRDFQKAASTVNHLIENIIEDSNEADYIAFGDVPEDSVTARLLEGINEGFGASCLATNPCPYVPLLNNYELYNQTLGSNMRRNLKIWERQALKDYRVEFVKYAEFGTVKEAMKIFFDLHQKRQVTKGNCGVFSDSIKRNFHTDVANAFAQKGWLSLFFLIFNDKPVSTVYSYEYNGKLYAYLCGFDPEYARYRPGHLAFKNLIQYGIRRKLRELDFLRGDEEYKSRWRGVVRTNLEFRIPKRGLRSRFYNWTANGRSSSYIRRVPMLAQRLFEKVL
jgi:CelD/BcsL family acetyltransferase involved in cellulose biosynthesis